MSLYLKYRPATLEQVRGNIEIVSTLENMLNNPKTCPHSFLLHGPTGCGKTTIARIIADRLGCKGNDFIEVNASDKRGIESIREIINSSQYKPIEGDCRIWLIDEVHRWTGEAQDSSLKILEDTPPHVYFILCTTDPNKLKSTIRGRCQEFQVKPLNESQLTGLLRRVVREENETLEKEVYEQIAQDSLGHPRNALQILEQVLNSPVERRLETAKQTAAPQSQSIELCRALLKRASWKEILLILNGLKDQEPEDIRRHVLGYCQSVLLKGENDFAARIIEEFLEPTYNSGFVSIVYNCYAIIKN